MLKIVTPGSFGFDGPIASLVKTSSRGLRGNDLAEFVKRAGHSFAGQLDAVRPGEVPIHLIAMGATEFFGPNRNGDGFKQAACRDYHDTFVKYAHFFRDHKNKPGDLRYGRVIKSAYHAPMRRVELLVGLYEKEDAARAGGGTLGRVAEKELEKLAGGRDLGVSMACRIPYDVCASCGNQAAHRGEYCDTVAVKLAGGRRIPACKGFGCKEGLTKVAADGSIQHVDNPRPMFFDISHVYKPADRIAYAMGRLEKAAGVPRAPGGAALADLWDLEAPLRLLEDPGRPSAAAHALKLAAELARAEYRLGDRAANPHDLSFHPLVRPAIEDFPGHAKAASVLRALADERIALTPREWLVFAVGKEAAAECYDEVAQRMPGVFGRLVDDPGTEAALAENPYAADRAVPDLRVRAWAAKYAQSHAITPETVASRAQRAVIRGGVPERPRPLNKRAEDDHGGAEKLAREVAKYQIAFLAAATARDESEFPLCSTLIVRQNVLA